MGVINTTTRPNQPAKKPTLSKWLMACLLFGLLFIVIQLGMTLFDVVILKFQNPDSSAFIERYLRECTIMAKPCVLKQEWKDMADISPSLQKAVLVAEDDGFFMHEGINVEAIKKAMQYNIKKKKMVRGGSTISQQLVKNLFLSKSKNPLRKLREIIITLLMEKILDKHRILEIYLNMIEWGEGVYGAEAASQHYFNKTAQNLTRSEAAYLAAIIPNPRLYTNPAFSRKADRRRNMILRKMGQQSFNELN